MTEARRRDVEGATLKQKVDDIAHHVRVNDAKANGQEAEVCDICCCLPLMTLKASQSNVLVNIRSTLRPSENRRKKRYYAILQGIPRSLV